MKNLVFKLSVCAMLTVLPARTSPAAVNSWIKPGSGQWEEPQWSLGERPGPGQEVVITNGGWKAVAISPKTTAHYATNLTIERLDVRAPSDGHNQLLMNFAGTTTPLEVRTDFVLGPNASLASDFSALRAGSLYLQSPAMLENTVLALETNLVVGTSLPGELTMTNSEVVAQQMVVGLWTGGSVTQSGGTLQATNLILFAGSDYHLFQGQIDATTLDLQSLGDFPLQYGWQIRSGVAGMELHGGSMTFETARVGTSTRQTPSGRGELTLHQGHFTSSNLFAFTGRFSQLGGTNVLGNAILPALDSSDFLYELSGGTLITSNMSLGMEALAGPGWGNFDQTGGLHLNQAMLLRGEIRRQVVNARGFYRLSGGLLESGAMTIRSGKFIQTGGTNFTDELLLREAGTYALTNGTLVTSNLSMSTIACIEGFFFQYGGQHFAQKLSLETFVNYELHGGTLSVESLEVLSGGRLVVRGGEVSNPGTVTIGRGSLHVPGQTLEFGKLRIIEEPGVSVCYMPIQPTNALLDVGGFVPSVDVPGPTLIRFAQSRDVPWTAPLVIQNWCPTNGPGPDRVFFGTDARGLSAEQLSLVFFRDPVGWPQGTYPARMLETGEVVPAAPPSLSIDRSNGFMVLAWDGEFQLLTTTNLSEPFTIVPDASSPWTNSFEDPQRYFRLGN